MITKLSFQNFRGFRTLTIEPLKRVNLLIGGNDSGKTSVLEGIYLLFADPAKLNAFPYLLRNNQSGGQGGVTYDDFKNFWMWIFFEQNHELPLKILARLENGSEIALSVGEHLRPLAKPNPPDHYQALRRIGDQDSAAFTIGPSGTGGHVVPSQKLPKISVLSLRSTNPVQDAELYNEVALQKGGESKMENLMKVVEPRLQRLRYSKLPGTSSPLVYVDIGMSAAIPSTQMGHAFSRILHIYCQILVSKSQVFLIDEIENGIHHEVLPLFWKGLLTLSATERVQIFATTHSWECILAADQIAREAPDYDLNLIRLDRVDENVKATIIDEKTLTTAKSLEWEMR